MKVYIDVNDGFKCYAHNDREDLLPVDVLQFDGKCTAYIEGCRCKPDGYSWTRDDGVVFDGGEMITPWKPYNELAAAQVQYEADKAELAAAYQEGVNSV